MADVDYLYEPEGSQLHWDGLKPNPVQQASLSSPGTIHPADRNGMMGSSAAHAGGYQAPQAKATRPPTNDELLAEANRMLESQANQHAALMAAGPSTGASTSSTACAGPRQFL